MSVFDLSGVVLDLASGIYSVTRSAPGSTGTDGRFEPGAPTSLSVTASVQPLDGRDLLRLPEGLRTSELLKVYSPTRLFTQGAGQDPDLITIEGIPHQVETCEAWGPDGNYWKMIVRSTRRSAP